MAEPPSLFLDPELYRWIGEHELRTHAPAVAEEAQVQHACSFLETAECGEIPSIFNMRWEGGFRHDLLQGQRVC